MKIAILAILLLATPAQALLMSDAAGDQVLAATGGDFAGEEQGDLVGLDLEEVPEGFWFHAFFATLQGDMDGLNPSGGYVDIPLSFGGVDYIITLGKGPASITYYSGSVRRIESDGTATSVRSADTFESEDVKADETERSISYFVYRADLLDKAGRTPAAGDTFVLGQARSVVSINGAMGLELFPPQEILDFMPASADKTTFGVALGPKETTVRVTGADLFRRSNGAATTYRFDFLATNEGSEQRFAAGLEGMPTGWQARVAPSTFELAEGENRTLSVYVSTPFGHQHGGIDFGTLVVRGVEDPSASGGTLFGVRYLPVPQPAGHHNTLYVHTTKTSTATQQSVLQTVIPDHPRTPLYMNTLSEDDADTQDSITPAIEAKMDGSGSMRWLALLSPELGIGLTFQPEGSAALVARIEGGAPLGPGVISSRVMLVGTNGTDPQRMQHPISSRGVTDLLRASSQGITLDGSPVDYSATLMPTEAAGIIPFADSVDLVLEIQIDLIHPASILSATLPKLLPGAALDLPLLEYADPAAADGLVNEVNVSLEPSLREANPGDTLVWEIIFNPKDATLAAFGSESLDLQVAEKGDASFLVAHVPDDARDLDLIPIYVLASNANGEGSAVVNVRVTTAADVPDDSDPAAWLFKSQKDAPSLPLVAILGGLALAVNLRRRSA